MDRYSGLISKSQTNYDVSSGTIDASYAVPLPSSSSVGSTVVTSPKAVSGQVQAIATCLRVANHSAPGARTHPGCRLKFDVRLRRYNRDADPVGYDDIVIFKDQYLWESQTFIFDTPVPMSPGDEYIVRAEKTTVLANTVAFSVLLSGVEMSYGLGPQE